MSTRKQKSSESAQEKNLTAYRNELSAVFVSGANFILSGALSWIAVAFVYAMDMNLHAKAGISWGVGFVFMPVAFLVAKLFHIPSVAAGNPLSPMAGLLNAAQVLFTPFLVLLLIREPLLFMVALPTVTGAHLFLFGWLYNQGLYYAFSWTSVITMAALGYLLPAEKLWILPAVMAVMQGALGIRLVLGRRRP